jgi:hypothetical protein
MARIIHLTDEQHAALEAVLGAFNELAPEDQYEALEQKLPGDDAAAMHRIWSDMAMAVLEAKHTDDYGREA